jgi:pimeloyl-ACP methyl ester carboxylesterase
MNQKNPQLYWCYLEYWQNRHSNISSKPFDALPAPFRDSLLAVGFKNKESALFATPIMSDEYLKFLVLELKPFIDGKYSTLPDRDNTFIAGSSMGGLISMYAICEYPAIFGGAACLSTHWPGIIEMKDNPVPIAFLDYLRRYLPDPSTHKIYFDYGTATLDAQYERYQLQVDGIMQPRYTNQNWDP